jgi:hypothetical protein
LWGKFISPMLVSFLIHSVFHYPMISLISSIPVAFKQLIRKSSYSFGFSHIVFCFFM